MCSCCGEVVEKVARCSTWYAGTWFGGEKRGSMVAVVVGAAFETNRTHRHALEKETDASNGLSQLVPH